MKANKTTQRDTGAPKTTVFYDGSCPLCRAEIDLYAARDTAQALVLVDVSAPAAALPPALDARQAMARFHVLSADGELLSGGAAFAEIWKRLPGWAWAGRLASLPPFRQVLAASYNVFLMFRPRLVRRFVKHQQAGRGENVRQ